MTVAGTYIIFQTELHEFFHELREFDKTSKHFPFGDHFVDSHNRFFFITVNPLISPPWMGVGDYLFQTHLRGRGGGLFNLEKTMVSVLHKELQYKVEKLKYKRF